MARLAFDFRQAFKKDVVIDMICYRRRGHNEADDPSLTQPLMYQLIDNKRSVRKLYTEALIGRGDISVEEAEQALRDYQSQLEKVFQETRNAAEDTHSLSDVSGEVEREGQAVLKPQRPSADVPTAVTREVVDRVVASQLTMPDGFTVHPRLAPQLKRRAEMVETDSIDFGMGEALAIGSLLSEGAAVRIAGQDTRRGTFGHRHIVIVDAQDRLAVQAAQAAVRQRRQAVRLRLPALGVRRDGLRVRLLRGAAGGAGHVGGAVRRLRQRRADHRRRVHLLR